MASTNNVFMLVFAFVAIGLVGIALLYSIGSARIEPTVNFGQNYVMTDGTQQNTTVELVRGVAGVGDSVLLPGMLLIGALIAIGAIALATRNK